MNEQVGRIMKRMIDGEACPCCLTRGEEHAVVFSVAMIFGRTMVRPDIVAHMNMMDYLCGPCKDSIQALALEASEILSDKENVH